MRQGLLVLLALSPIFGCGRSSGRSELWSAAEKTPGYSVEKRPSISFLSNCKSEDLAEFYSVYEEMFDVASQLGFRSIPSTRLHVVWTTDSEHYSQFQNLVGKSPCAGNVASFFPRINTVLLGPLPTRIVVRRDIFAHEIAHFLLTSESVSTVEPGSWIVEGAAVWLAGQLTDSRNQSPSEPTEYSSKIGSLIRSGLLIPIDEFVNLTADGAETGRSIITHYIYNGGSKMESVKVYYLQARMVVEFLSDTLGKNFHETLSLLVLRGADLGALAELFGSADVFCDTYNAWVANKWE